MKDFFWVEKYRPKTVSDCILPEKLKQSFQGIVDSGELQHMLFTGSAGLGKTTVARALCDEMGLDYLFINASDERNIDVLRNKIKNFASSVSLTGGYKVVLLDEADNLNEQSTQKALRAFMEKFAQNCRFILTCNFKNKIIEPLHSRCAVYEFNTSKKEMAKLAASFHKRSKEILEAEGVPYDEKTVASVIMKHAPDWRRILNELQRTSSSGEITDGTVAITETSFDDLFSHLKGKDFKKMRQWIANNISADTANIIRGVYNAMSEKVENQSIPQLVLILAEYQYKAAFVADHELNMVACMTEIMTQVDFK